MVLDEANYLDFLFDVNRGGLREITDKIVGYLDYKSFVNFKRSSVNVYAFFNQNPHLEEQKLNRKLASDWTSGNYRDHMVQAPGLVSCADIFDDNERVAIGVNENVQICDIKNSETLHVLSGNDSCVTCIAVLSSMDVVASGSANGKLMLWSNETGNLRLVKQLFGRIEALRWKQDQRYLLSAHFGRSYDAGCITIRLVESPENLTVIFSLYQDVFPVFCVDISNKYLATVEWSGTFNNVHAGIINVYKNFEPTPITNLSMRAEATFTCCKFVDDDLLLTGGHDKIVSDFFIVDVYNCELMIRFSCDCGRFRTRDL